MISVLKYGMEMWCYMWMLSKKKGAKSDIPLLWKYVHFDAFHSYPTFFLSHWQPLPNLHSHPLERQTMWLRVGTMRAPQRALSSQHRCIRAQGSPVIRGEGAGLEKSWRKERLKWFITCLCSLVAFYFFISLLRGIGCSPPMVRAGVTLVAFCLFKNVLMGCDKAVKPRRDAPRRYCSLTHSVHPTLFRCQPWHSRLQFLLVMLWLSFMYS